MSPSRARAAAAARRAWAAGDRVAGLGRLRTAGLEAEGDPLKARRWPLHAAELAFDEAGERGMTAFLNALEEAGEVLPDEHRCVAAVGVAGDVNPPSETVT